MMDIKTRIETFLSADQQRLIHTITDISAELGCPIYIVGGSVRDLILGRPIQDLDFTLEGDSGKLAESISGKMGGKVVVHSKFGTARWTLDESSFERLGISGQASNAIPPFIDFVSTRSEIYEEPGALPTVSISTIDDDLRRRDFTVNAMAVRLDGDHFGELLDPLNGQDDLDKKIIRVIHPRSFVDDPTRIFRAIRYEGRYSFQMDSETEKLVNKESLSVLSKLSGERIRHELDLIFAEKLSPKMIFRAGYMGLFEYIHPSLHLYNENYGEFLDINPNLDIEMDRVALGYTFWMIDLSQDEIISISRRLDFTADLTHIVWGASKLRKSIPYLINGKPSAWTLALEKLPALSIYANYLVSRENALLDYLSLWRFVRPKTTGDDLLGRGLPPGPRYGEILTRLRAAWLDGEIRDHSQELEMLKSLLKKSSG